MSAFANTVPASIRLCAPWVDQEEADAVRDVLRDGYLSVGEVTARFEAAVRGHVGCRHFVATSSGTAALHVALQALGIGAGDRVIVPVLTYVATAQAVCLLGATPLLADVDSASGNLTAETAAAAWQPGVRAVLPVHLRGFPVALGPLRAWASNRDVMVVEDAAHAFAVDDDQVPVGRESLAACFSFDPVKIVTCGEGGGVATHDDALAETLRTIRNLGLRRAADGVTGDVVAVGGRHALPNLNAAIGLVQLSRLDAKRERRRVVCQAYNQALKGLDWLSVMPWHGTDCPAYFMVRVPAFARAALRAHLTRHGIETGLHYPLLTDWTLFRSARGFFPAAEALAAELVSLPLHDRLSDSDVARICEAVGEFDPRRAEPGASAVPHGLAAQPWSTER